MKGFRLFAVLLVILIFSGCAPIGGIGGSEEADAFWITPKLLEYTISTPFLRDNDLSIFAFRDGVVVEIPADTVDIGVAEDSSVPDSINWVSEDEWVHEGGAYWFDAPGEKIIVVNYQAMSDRYTIQVKEPGGTTPPGGNGGTGIIIEWGS